MIRQRPEHLLADHVAAGVQARPFVRHELIDGTRLPQVAMREIGARHAATLAPLTLAALTPCPSPGEGGDVGIELQNDLVAVVGETDLLDGLAGNRNRLSYPPVLGVIRVRDGLRCGRPRSRSPSRQPSDPTLPGVVGHRDGCDSDALGAIALGVIRVRVSAVAQGLVVRANHVAQGGRIAVGVPGVGYSR